MVIYETSGFAEEDLKRIEDMEVPVMKQAIGAYRAVTATDEFRQLEQMRADARNREASALGHARREGIAIGEETEREKWQGVIAEKDAALADKDATLKDKDAALKDKDAALKDKDAENEQLRARLSALQAQLAKGN